MYEKKYKFVFLFAILVFIVNMIGCSNQSNRTDQMRQNEETSAADVRSEGKGVSDTTNVKVEETEMKPEAGYRAPNFTFTDQDGNEVNLNERKGKPVLLVFWASW